MSKVEDEKEISQHIDNSLPVVDAESGGKPKYAANSQLDDAARLLQEAGGVEYSAAESKRVLRMIDLWVCLPMCITYLYVAFPRADTALWLTWQYPTARQVVSIVRCRFRLAETDRTGR
jgi:hypothetical protein